MTSSNHWLSAYYVQKFITNSSRNASTNNAHSNRMLETPTPIQNSIMVRQLALDRALRKQVIKDRRRELRQDFHAKAVTASAKGGARRFSFAIEDYGEDEWSTDEEEDEKSQQQESALLRESRIKVMKSMPKSYDEDMAQRYKVIKQVNDDHESSELTASDWNTMRKRLISAKMKECVDEKKVSVSDKIYTLVRKIGDGGFSNVYHVYDDKRKHFALKLVNLLRMDGYTDKDLMNEIELLKLLEGNQCVIKVHSWEHRQTEQVDMLYMIMDYGEADLHGILSEHKSQNNLTINKIRFFWEEILNCVQAVHEKNIIHLDIKPENFIMVCGILKIIDFGLAHRINNSKDKLISPASMPGSFQYCAPENFRQIYEDGTLMNDSPFNDDSDDEEDKGETHVELTMKADIWSIGILLYKMVYDGMHPYGTVSGGRVSKIFALKSSSEVDFPKLKFSETVSNGLMETMKTTLRKDPIERADTTELLKMDFLKGPLFEKI